MKRWPGWRIALLMLFAIASITFILFAHPFLAVTKRVDADTLVIEGWIPGYMLSPAAKEFHAGKYSKLLVSGLQNNPAETEESRTPDAARTAAELEKLGVPRDSIITCPAPFAEWLRTSKTARAVREKVDELGLKPRGINVITAGPHARETWVAYEHAFGDQTPVGIISIPKNNYPADRWWLSRQGLIWVPKGFRGVAQGSCFRTALLIAIASHPDAVFSIVMCGIAGCLNLRAGPPPDEALLRQMLGMIRHRGPEQFGIFLDDHVGLGNARLSIVDLAAGQQPITTEDGRYWIVYNGEIFNHAELRPELEKAGHRFATHTDTEVFLHLFEQEGPKCLHRLNGQFAVAIWDTLKQTLFLARDRLGVRPLFYWMNDDVLLFGSEVKALAAHPAVKLTLDPLALDQIFTGWSCQPPRTVFREVKQLPPGHFAVVSRNGIHFERYWQATFAGDEADRSQRPEADWLEELSSLLTDATRLRLMADVPVGAYLSGGLDSSIIAALMRKHAAGKIDTFSIAFTDSAFDESEHQRRMAKYLGTDHQVVEASHADIGAVFPEVVWHCETPLLRTAPAPMYLLAQLVHRSRYKVVLTGEGADEFFAGYDIFKEARIRAFWAREPNSTRRPQLLQRIYPDLQNLTKIGTHYLAAFFGEGLADTTAPGYSHAIRWRNTRRTQRFFSKDLTAQIQKDAKPFLDSVPLPEKFGQWNLLERAQYLEIASFMSTYLLSSQGDRVAMAHSVEGRFPFLDYRVAEFAGRLPARLRLNGLRDKYLLRKLGASLLPAEIWNRPKKPYRAPIHRSFFNAQEAPYVRELLSASALRDAGLFNPLAVEKLVAKIDQGQPLGETDDMAVAGLLSTQLVHQRFVRDFRRSNPLSGQDDVLLCDHRSTTRQKT